MIIGRILTNPGLVPSGLNWSEHGNLNDFFLDILSVAEYNELLIRYIKNFSSFYFSL